MIWTKVFVYASGNTIEFKLTHGDADRFKTMLTRQLTTPSPAASAAIGLPVDVADQLTKLAALRDQGVLTEEEFAAQKARLLA